MTRRPFFKIALCGAPAAALAAFMCFGLYCAWWTWSGPDELLLSLALERQDALVTVTERFPKDGTSPLTGLRRKGLTYLFRRGPDLWIGRTVWTWDSQRWAWRVAVNSQGKAGGL